MNKDKQIEEMANAMCNLGEASCQECANHWDFVTVPKCDLVKRAERLYNAGYRKASEVAREIIDEIYKILDAEYRQYDTATLSDTLNKMYMSSRNTVIKITAELTELKKKYTKEE